MSRKNTKTIILILIIINFVLQSLLYFTAFYNVANAQSSYSFSKIPKAETLDPLVISNSNKVLLKGKATNVSVELTQMKGYFEWGTTKQLGNSTLIQSLPNARVATFSYLLTDLLENKTYYYRAVVFNEYGAEAGEIKKFRTGREENIPPPVQINTQKNNLAKTEKVITYPPKYYLSGGKARAKFVGFIDISNAQERGAVAWFEWGSTQSLRNKTSSIVLRNRNNGTYFESEYIYNLIPNKTYYVRAVVKDKNGEYFGDTISFSVPGQVISSNNQSNNLIESSTLPRAVTYLPIIIRSSSAPKVKFQGYVETNEVRGVRYSSNVWFEWGDTPDLGNRTTSQIFGTKGIFTSKESFIGFTPGKTYYYRAVVKDPYGIAYGDIVSFSISETDIIQPQDNSGTPSFSLFGNTQSETIIDIRKPSDIKDNTDSTEENKIYIESKKNSNAKNQIAITGSVTNGILPNTLVGWVFLTIVIFVVMGLLIYVMELRKELKEFEEGEDNNNNYVNDDTGKTEN